MRLCIQEARDLLGSDWKLGVGGWWLAGSLKDQFGEFFLTQ